MATGVGLHIAEHACTAAVVSDEGDPHFIVREPILHLSEDGDAALGGTTAPPGYTHTITGFVAAVGDPAGVAVDDGEAYRGEDLLATAMFCLINLLAEHLHGPAEFYATHPAGWPAAQVLALRGALDYLGLKSVALIGEDELPQPSAHAPAQDPGRRIAESAGLAALTVVLDTPAGATPPDPGTTENSSLDTVVMPKIGDTPAKAYSAVTPVVDPEATYGGPSLGVLAAGLGVAADTDEEADKDPDADTTEPPNTEAVGAATTATPAPGPGKAPARKAGNSGDKKSNASRRTTVLVALAALAGLMIGALGVTAFLRPGSAEPGVPATTSMTTTPAAPPPPPPVEPTPAPEPTFEPDPSYPAEPPAPIPEPPVTTTEPPVTHTTTPAPTETSAPGSTEPSDPTGTTPTESGTESTTTRSRPTFLPPIPLPFSPDSPDMDLPDTGSQEGSREEAG